MVQHKHCMRTVETNSSKSVTRIYFPIDSTIRHCALNIRIGNLFHQMPWKRIGHFKPPYYITGTHAWATTLWYWVTISASQYQLLGYPKNNNLPAWHNDQRACDRYPLKFYLDMICPARSCASRNYQVFPGPLSHHLDQRGIVLIGIMAWARRIGSILLSATFAPLVRDWRSQAWC